MKKNDIVQTVEQYLADTFYCTLEDLNKTDVVFTINPNEDKTYMKIMAYKNSVVICASENMSKQVQKLLSGKSRDEIFECPLVYGQTIHYITDVDQMKEIKMPDGFIYEILKRGVVPFYSVSVTNIASQRVAVRAGYVSCWVDTFGMYMMKIMRIVMKKILK